MPVGGVNGPNEQYIHPIYKNMSPSKAKTIDKIAAMNVKNKGKASEIVQETQKVKEHIKELSRVRGSRTRNSGDSSTEPKYKGARGTYSSPRGRTGGGAGGMFNTKNR
jgi:hypothetical protein